jgi:hypothetical protein
MVAGGRNPTIGDPVHENAKRARASVDEARQLGNYVGTEHLLGSSAARSRLSLRTWGRRKKARRDFSSSAGTPEGRPRAEKADPLNSSAAI